MSENLYRNACIYFASNTTGIELEENIIYNSKYSMRETRPIKQEKKIIVKDSNSGEIIEADNYLSIFERYELDEMILIDYNDGLMEKLKSYGITKEDVEELELKLKWSC